MWSLSLEAVPYLCFSTLNPFLMVIAYQAQAEEEWTIDRYETLSYARVSGEEEKNFQI